MTTTTTPAASNTSDLQWPEHPSAAATGPTHESSETDNRPRAASVSSSLSDDSATRLHDAQEDAHESTDPSGVMTLEELILTMVARLLRAAQEGADAAPGAEGEGEAEHSLTLEEVHAQGFEDLLRRIDEDRASPDAEGGELRERKFNVTTARITAIPGCETRIERHTETGVDRVDLERALHRGF